MLSKTGKFLALFAVLFVLACPQGFLRRDCVEDSMRRSARGSICRHGRFRRDEVPRSKLWGTSSFR